MSSEQLPGGQRHPSRTPLGLTLDRVMAMHDDDPVTLREIARIFGSAGPLKVLLITALIAVSPLSGIPMVSAACGIVIALTAAQLLVQRERLWLPAFLARRAIAARRLKAGLARIAPMARWLEARMQPRWQPLIREPMRGALLAVCMMCGLIMPFMELIPFSASLLALTVSVIALALIVEDGVFAAAAAMPLATAGALIAVVVVS